MIYALDGVVPATAGDAFWVAPNAVVIGDVVLGPDSSVWFGAVLRGDNERITLGAGSNVQENCILHTDPGFPLLIGADVTVGHGAILHGCTIGDGALIGMGATVLNGARIGRNCLIGARALVGEGKEIPNNSVVLGVPGRVTGEVSAAQAERMRAGAGHYVVNWRRFRVGLGEKRPGAPPPDPAQGGGP